MSSLITKTASDGSLINVLNGRTYQNFEALLFQTDYDGEPMWSRTYPASYSQSNTHAEDLVENEIKGYSFTGRMFNATAPSTGYDIHLVKTDVNGKTGTCEKEVRVISHKIRLCEDKLDYKITTMRELKISTDNVKLDLKIKKCDDLSAASSLEENTISPNPGESMITVSGYTKGTRIAIYDLQGVLKKKANFQHDNKIDISDLPKGVYVVEVSDANGLVHKQRFIKN